MSRDIIHLTPLPQWPPAPEATYQVDPSDFSEGRDVLFLRPQQEEAELTAQREAVEAEIHHQREIVSNQLAKLEAANHEGEFDVAIDTLSDMLRTIDASLATARYGSAADLAALAAGLGQQASAVQKTTAAVSGEATVQAGVLMADITMLDMAERFTAEHFAQMSDQQLDAVGRRVDAHVEQSLANDARHHARLERIAAENGTTAELDTYRKEREELDRREAEARARGDREELARVAAERSRSRAQAAEAIGADADYIAELRRIEEADRAALRLKEREMAEREARAAGKSVEEIEKSKDVRANEAIEKLDDHVADIAKRRGVDTQVQKAEDRRSWAFQERDYVETEDMAKTTGKDAETYETADMFSNLFDDPEPSTAEPTVAMKPSDDLKAAADKARAAGAITQAATPTEEQPDGPDPDAPTAVAAASPKQGKTSDAPKGRNA